MNPRGGRHKEKKNWLLDKNVNTQFLLLLFRFPLRRALYADRKTLEYDYQSPRVEVVLFSF